MVLGIDGVPWNLLRKWSEAGKLPNFQRFFNKGTAGPLESTVPPTTPLAWPSIATGTWPDKHDIYGFHAIDDDYTHKMYTGKDRNQPALWDILSPSVTGNVPMTYPVDEIEGAMVSGMITPEIRDGFAHPPELRDEIEREIPEYQIGLDWYEYTNNRDEFIEDLDDLLDARRKLMNKLAQERDWRLFFFVYVAPDRLQHLIWDEDEILRHYRKLDEIVGEAISCVKENDATLYIVSDHGFGPISKFVNLNSLLAQQGFLTQKDNDGIRGALSKLGVEKKTVLDTIDRVGITPEKLIRHLPKSIIDGVAEQIPGDHGLYDVDFEETTAFAHDPSQIYINDTSRFEHGIVPSSDIESVKQDVSTALSQITDPDTGERVLELHDGDELFPTDSDAPDLIAVGRGQYEEKTKVSDEVFAPANGMAGGHRPEGVFLAWGPNISAGSAPKNASVVDVAPTVLHGVGEPVPDTTDGRVLKEIFARDTGPAKKHIATQSYHGTTVDTNKKDADENFDDVEDRLRGLGYLE